MKKYMGNKKEVLLFYLLMIAVDWLVCGSGDSCIRQNVSKIPDRRILHTGGHLPGKEINDDHYGQKRIISD